MNNDPEEDLPVGELPEEIGEAASDGDFERVKAFARDAGAVATHAPSSSSSARGTTASSGTSLVSGARRPKTH